MPVKITISFSDPEDPEAFVSHYVNTHVPMVNDLPGLRAFEWGRALTNFDGRSGDLIIVAKPNWPIGGRAVGEAGSHGQQGRLPARPWRRRWRRWCSR